MNLTTVTGWVLVVALAALIAFVLAQTIADRETKAQICKESYVKVPAGGGGYACVPGYKL